MTLNSAILRPWIFEAAHFLHIGQCWCHIWRQLLWRATTHESAPHQWCIIILALWSTLWNKRRKGLVYTVISYMIIQQKTTHSSAKSGWEWVQIPHPPIQKRQSGRGLYNASSASPRYTENLLSKLSWFPLAPFRIGVCRSEKSLKARWRHITEDVNKFNECYVQTQEVCTLIVCLWEAVVYFLFAILTARYLELRRWCNTHGIASV